MSLALNRLALATLCVLPALALNVSRTGTPLIATFMYACEDGTPEPRLTTRYLGEGKPKPRDPSAQVTVYERGVEPGRRYRVIGEVRVLASTGRMSVDELKEWACRGARKLGGDAVVAVTCDDAASVTPKAGDVGLLYLTANVAQWE